MAVVHKSCRNTLQVQEWGGLLQGNDWSLKIGHSIQTHVSFFFMWLWWCSRWPSWPMSGVQFQPVRRVPPHLMLNQFWGKQATRSTISGVVRTVHVTPAVRRNKLHYVWYSIVNEGLESSWIPNQPVKDYGTVCPGINTRSCKKLIATELKSRYRQSFNRRDCGLQYKVYVPSSILCCVHMYTTPVYASSEALQNPWSCIELTVTSSE